MVLSLEVNEQDSACDLKGTGLVAYVEVREFLGFSWLLTHSVQQVLNQARPASPLREPRRWSAAHSHPLPCLIAAWPPPAPVQSCMVIWKWLVHVVCGAVTKWYVDMQTSIQLP